MANTRTRQALSDDAKLAKVEIMARNHQIKADKIEQLKEKYGPYAYDVLLSARSEPTNLMQRIGQKPLSSNKALQYFIDNEIDTATLAKAVKQDEMKVQATLANYNINKAETAAATPAEVTQAQNQAVAVATEFDSRVDTQTNPTPQPVLTAAQEKQMKAWAKQVGLNGQEVIDNLTEKYNSLAYDIMRDSMNKPSVVMKNMQEKAQGSSKKTVQYFMENDVPAEKLAAALKKPVSEVEAHVKTTPPVEQPAPDVTQTQSVPADSTQMTKNDYANLIPNWENMSPREKLEATAQKQQLYIAQFEDIKFSSYWDSAAKKWTVGMGSTTQPNGKPVTSSTQIKSAEELTEYWKHYANKQDGLYDKMEKYLPIDKMTSDEIAVFANLGWNAGPGVFQAYHKNSKGQRVYEDRPSKFVEDFNKYKETGDKKYLESCLKTISRYNTSKGRVVSGLTKRRDLDVRVLRGDLALDMGEAPAVIKLGDNKLYLSSLNLGAPYSIGKFPQDSILLAQRLNKYPVGMCMSDTIRVEANKQQIKIAQAQSRRRSTGRG